MGSNLNGVASRAPRMMKNEMRDAGLRYGFQPQQGCVPQPKVDCAPFLRPRVKVQFIIGKEKL